MSSIRRSCSAARGQNADDEVGHAVERRDAARQRNVDQAQGRSTPPAADATLASQMRHMVAVAAQIHEGGDEKEGGQREAEVVISNRIDHVSAMPPRRRLG